MKSNYKRLGDYIRQVDVRNRDLAVERLLGKCKQTIYTLNSQYNWHGHEQL